MCGYRADWNAQTGDHLGVYPENDPELVQRLAARLNVRLDDMFSLTPIVACTPAVLSSVSYWHDLFLPDVSVSCVVANIIDGPCSFSVYVASTQPKFPVPCSFREAFTCLLEIAHPPRKAVVRVLAEYAQDAAEKEQLMHYTDATTGFVEVLERFRSVQPDMGHLLEVLPAMAVRYYSISSSPKVDPWTISITAVVTGVCTNYLKRIANEKKRMLFFSALRLSFVLFPL